MKVNELRPNQGKVEIEGVITALKDTRNIAKPGFSGKVRNGTFRDDSGEVEISLWNDQCDTVNIGDTVKITNGWVSEYQGKLQLSTGKFGKLEITKKGEGSSAPQPVRTNAMAGAAVPPKPKLDEEQVGFDDDISDDDGVDFDEESVD